MYSLLLAVASPDRSGLLPIVALYALLIVFNVGYYSWLFWYSRKQRAEPRNSLKNRPKSGKGVQPELPLDDDGNLKFAEEVEDDKRDWDGERDRSNDPDYLKSADYNDGYDGDGKDDGREWDTGADMRMDTSKLDNSMSINSLGWLLNSTVNYLTLQPIYMGVALKNVSYDLYRAMAQQLHAKDARAIVRVVVKANMAVELCKLGFPEPALAAVEDALKLFDEACVPPDMSVKDMMVICIEDLNACGYPEAASEMRHRGLHRTQRADVFLRDVLGLLITMREAARVQVMVPGALELVQEAQEAVVANQVADAIAPLQKLADRMDDKLSKTDLKWPLAAVYFDLAMAKARCGGFAMSALGDLAEANRLQKLCDAPDPRWRDAIVRAAKELLS